MMNYTDVTRIIDYLESTDKLIVITPVNMSGFVAHTQSINAEGDIVPGAVNTADLSFTLLDVQGSVSAYQGREFIYRKGYALAPVRTKLSTPCVAYAESDNVTAYLSTTGRAVTVTDGVDTNTYALDAEGSTLFINGNTLTVLYADEPYAEQYNISGATLTGPTVPDMTAYEKNIASEYARQNVAYTSAGDVVKEFKVTTILGTRYLDTTEFEMHTKGIFTASRPKRGTGGQYTVTATDRMEKFSVDCMDAVKSVTGGTTAADLLAKVCTIAGVSLAQQDRYNADFKVVVSDDLESCTGEQLLAWLGEVMGCSWHINSAGELESVWFRTKDIRLTRDDYTSFAYETFMVDPIDKVMTGSNYADATGYYGPGANTLVISGNVLIPYTTPEDLASFSAGLLEQVGAVPEYRPGTLSGYANANISPGDVIQVDNDDDEPEYVCVTQMTENGFVLDITSSGNQRRDAQNYSSTTLASLKKSVDDLTKETGEFPARWAQAIQDTVEVITGGMGGTRVDLFNDAGKPSGTAYLFDGDSLETAKKVLVMNAGGIAFYENGFNADNPSASVPAYVVMNNMGQVNASSIMTGTLDAKLVKVENLSASDITSGSLDAAKITVKNIDADNITSGSLDAAKITVKNIDADNITSGSISGSRISGGTIEGTTFRTVGNNNWKLVLELGTASAYNGSSQVGNFGVGQMATSGGGNVTGGLLQLFGNDGSFFSAVGGHLSCKSLTVNGRVIE